MRTTHSIIIGNVPAFKQQLLIWAQQFREASFLDSNDYPQAYSSYDCVLAVDAMTAIQTDFHDAFDKLSQYQQTAKDWLFGYMSYDLKNDTEPLQSANFDGLGFPELFFFQPKKLFLLNGNQLEILYLKMCDDEMESDLNAIFSIQYPKPNTQNPKPNTQSPIQIQQRVPKEKYLEKIAAMLSHIHLGDIYEANFCMEFFAQNALLNPYETYQNLNAVSAPPFATFLKNDKHFLMSASPERYLRKANCKIISQPIKGTMKRSSDKREDNVIKQQLSVSEKERAENIMIVDLVRNDLSRTAAKGTVKVEELCGVYSFKQVHHLISTVVSEISAKQLPVDVIKTTFPMGSMTGAPKISAMNIIENLEETKRGLYSGAVGYFAPSGDFDFNVVIRSILYNAANRYVSFSVGSAITAASSPESEYEECLLKARAMLGVLENPANDLLRRDN